MFTKYWMGDKQLRPVNLTLWRPSHPVSLSLHLWRPSAVLNFGHVTYVLRMILPLPSKFRFNSII